MKKLTLLAAVFFLFSILLAVLSWNKIATRLKIEAVNSVEIAVDLTGGKNNEIDGRNFTVFCAPGGALSLPSSRKILFVRAGEKFIIKNDSRYCFKNNIIPGEMLQAGVEAVVCLSEFAAPVNYQKLARKRILTLHRIRKEEAVKLSEEDTLKRFIRSAVERNIKVLVVPEAKMAEKLKNALTARGFQIKQFDRNPVLLPAVPGNQRLLFKKTYALLIAVIFPLFGFFLLRYFKNTFVRFSAVTLVSLLAALIIAGTLSETDFMLKLSLFSGAKLALLLPPLAVFFILAYENKNLFDKRTAGILTVIILGIIITAVIARSGNYSMPLLPFEKGLREWFENVFVARPRFKEFLIGHPAMLLGLYLYPRAKLSLEKIAAVFLLALGMLGQTSLINTFCHPQADFMISVLRTVFGLLAGAAIGGVLILCLKIVKKY